MNPGLLMLGSFARDASRYPGATQLLARHMRGMGWPVRLASFRRWKPVRFADMLWNVLAGSRGYEVVVIDTFSSAAFWYAVTCARIARQLGKRVVLFLHGGGLPERTRRMPARVRGLLACADRIVAPSRYLAREVGEVLGFHVDVIENAIDVASYPSRVRTRPKPRLFWLRAFRHEYLPEIAIEAAARLRHRRSELELIMAGPERDGSLARCRELARRLGIEQVVRFPGMIDKAAIRRIGGGCDLFLNTTSVDNTPVSVIEAMAMGHCILSTNVGGIPDLLLDEKTALLLPPRDSQALAAAIERVLDDPGLAERLSRNAAAAAAFAMERVVPRWHALLGELA